MRRLRPAEGEIAEPPWPAATSVNEGTPISLRRPGSVNLAMTYSRTPAGVHYHRRLHA